jgi:hypothetical protein
MRLAGHAGSHELLRALRLAFQILQLPIQLALDHLVGSTRACEKDG